jgi:hypothetical protein
MTGEIVLEFRVKLPNENSEVMEFEAERTRNTDERYTLRIPGIAKEGIKSETVTLSGEEFDQVAALVSKFRKMKGIPDES